MRTRSSTYFVLFLIACKCIILFCNSQTFCSKNKKTTDKKMLLVHSHYQISKLRNLSWRLLDNILLCFLIDFRVVSERY